MVEIWTKVIYITNDNEIIEFDDYEISDRGNIRSNKNGKVRELKLRITHDGYLFTQLIKNNKLKWCTVHRLVLSSFMTDQYFSGAQVDHINSIRDDNRLENLRWLSHEENCNTDHYKKAHSEAIKGRKHSDETKRKIGEAHKGKKLSDESKRKISEARKGKMKGENNPMFGKKHSNETKQKISEANKGSKCYRAKSCIYDDKEFGCIKDAYHYAIENKMFNKGYDTFKKMIKRN